MLEMFQNKKDVEEKRKKKAYACHSDMLSMLGLTEIDWEGIKDNLDTW